MAFGLVTMAIDKRTMCRVALIIKLILHLFAHAQCSSTKTYDLLRYSHVGIIKTVSQRDTTKDCVVRGNNYECRQPSANTSEIFKQNIWKNREYWKLVFNEHTKEIKLNIRFQRMYLINNLLLSFKEAKNISAVSVDIISKSNVIYSIQYAVSDMLCDFFFPSSSKCIVKSDLSDGIIHHQEMSVKADHIAIHLFPPIVNSYDKTHFYSINQLFIGGCCYCGNSRSNDCAVSIEDNLANNDGLRYVLKCSAEKHQLIIHNSHVVRYRRRREACPCSSDGTLYGLCKPFIGITQQCPCKPNYVGISCDKCATGYFGYPKCIACNCDYVGSISSTCNITSGQCKCEPRYSGLKCDKCAPGRYNFPFCYPCACPATRTNTRICHPITGKCLCLDRFTGRKCTTCKKPFLNFPVCQGQGCKCSKHGGFDGTCTSIDQCKCRPEYAGKKCDKCAKGHGLYPGCKSCNCDPFGSHSPTFCNPKNGQCKCKTGFIGIKCSECTRSGLTYPHCSGRDGCVCDVAGTRVAVKTEGRCIPGHSCQCKKNVIGTRCSHCKPNSFNLSASHPDGCMNCRCSADGSFGQLTSCDEKTGQCSCKPNVIGRKCNLCREGFYVIDRWNLFGCSPCNCDIGGSVSPNCNEHGTCRCKPNFHGKKCDKLQKGPYYVPNYYHLLYEVENATVSGEPVIYRYYSAEFMNFTGVGYFVFGPKQSAIKLLLDVPKTRKYQILVRYYLKQDGDTTMLVNLESRDKATSYAAVVEFEHFEITISTPKYALVLRTDQVKELVLTKGTWEMEMSSISASLLVDHVVLIPEEYYTGSKLQPDDITACVAGQVDGTICRMYKYISLEQFQLLQAEHGTDSKGYGHDIVRKTKIFKDPDYLSQLPILNQMAELSREQIALTLEVSARTTDFYYLVITYFNPDQRTYRLDMYDGDSGKRGQVEVVPCLYQFMCRLVIHHTDGTPLAFKYLSNKTSEITFLGNIRGSLAIDYIALVPVSRWSPDYIIPSKLCYKRNLVCLQNIKFYTPDDVVRIPPTEANPVNSLSKTVHVKSSRDAVFIASQVKSGKYVLVYQFYQPNLPSFYMNVRLSVEGTLVSTELVKVSHCTANSGCRSVLMEYNAINGVSSEPVSITIEIPEGKELWIDSLFLVPSSSFDKGLLTPKRLEMTQQFNRLCVNQDKLPLLKPPGNFCMQALVKLTTEFTNSTYDCKCNLKGSLLRACDRVGGQCKCRPGVVGRDCSRCKTGDHNFPYCKPCNCFIPGSVNANCNKYGQCKCKPNYTGWRCDRCQKKQWGFPVCRACDCEASGSFSLTCRRSDGQCSCLNNFSGKKCNRCQVGYFDFPDCRSCNCNPSGIRITKDSPTGCFKSDRNRCDCKSNVEGSRCDVCKNFFYGLNVSNPLGCSACNCSPFGTVRGAGPCNKQTGQCLCHPNVVGKDCSTCKDGFYVVETDHVFSCQPCLCSLGGSLHGICDKLTGQCKCKQHVTGIKCNQLETGGYYLPSIGKYNFLGQDISPGSPRGVIKGLDGTFVNSSYASARMNFKVTNSQTYYLLMTYALVEKMKALIDIEFNNGGSFTYITHKLRAKKTKFPLGEIVKEGEDYLVLNFTRGEWHMQAMFQETIFLNQITLVPSLHFGPYRVTRSIDNPCTIKDSRRFCAMYTYYDLVKASATIYEAESLTRGNMEYFDLKIYKGANINGAISLKRNEFLFTSKYVSLNEQYYVVIQYLNLEREKLSLEVKLRSNSNYTIGYAELFPCSYAFACRQVVLLRGWKLPFTQSGVDTFITLKVKAGKAAFIDFIALVPLSKWTSNILIPAFYCTRRFSRCIDSTFPMTDNMIKLDAKTARGAIKSYPPESQPPSESVLLTKYNRNLRWMSPMKVGGYYLIIHYFQPIMESFYAKVILTTYQRADAGKILFEYCPSIYGCRAVVHYLEEDIEQRFVINGNIMRATFTLPYNARVWVESILLVNPIEYKERGNILKLNPLDLTKKYLRKCAGKKPDQLNKNIRGFCMSSTFELILGLGQNPQPCKCHPQGTVGQKQCDQYDGHCACKRGFLGRDCSSCVEGSFPDCRPRSIIT